jgi:hypothetical protein
LINLYLERIIGSYTEDSTISDALTTLTQQLEASKFQEAFVSWSEAKETLDPYVYWHNLGVIYKLQNKLPEARHALEMARYNAIYASETEQQITELYQQLPSSPLSGQESALNGIIALGPEKLYWVGLILSLGMLFFVSRKLKMWMNGLLVFLAAMPLIVIWLFLENSFVFIAKSPIEIYSGPSVIFKTGQEIPIASRVMGKTEDDWLKLYGSGGEVFWVKTRDAKKSVLWLWGNVND